MSRSRPHGGCTETAEQWLSLIHWVIRHRLPSHVRDRISDEQAFQAGVIGLMNAIRLFDASRGVTFKTYAGIKIRWAILIEAGLTRTGWARPEASIDSASPAQPHHVERLTAPAPVELPLELQELLDALPARERAALQLHRLDGLPLAQVGAQLGVTRQRAHQLVRAAEAKLRGLLLQAPLQEMLL